MKKLILAVSAAAVLAAPAAPAAAADIPDLNCGIVSCTYQIEQQIESARETGSGIVESVVDCATGTVRVTLQALQGIYGMHDCSIG
jgi:hypothetical protein